MNDMLHYPQYSDYEEMLISIGWVTRESIDSNYQEYVRQTRKMIKDHYEGKMSYAVYYANYYGWDRIMNYESWLRLTEGYKKIVEELQSLDESDISFQRLTSHKHSYENSLGLART